MNNPPIHPTADQSTQLFQQLQHIQPTYQTGRVQKIKSNQFIQYNDSILTQQLSGTVNAVYRYASSRACVVAMLLMAVAVVVGVYGVPVLWHAIDGEQSRNYRSASSDIDVDAQYIQLQQYSRYTPAMLQNIVSQMMHRPIHHNNAHVQYPYYRVPTSHAYMAYRLKLQPSNQLYRMGEYYYYDSKYDIGNARYGKQSRLCVIAAARNLLKGHYTHTNNSTKSSNSKQNMDNIYNKQNTQNTHINNNNNKYKSESVSASQFLQSISRQNYSNYRLIITDDASQDNTSQYIHQYLQQYHPQLYGKTVVITNQQRLYTLHNKHNMITNYCQQGDIVVDVDADDQIIGTQVFNLINVIYHTGLNANHNTGDKGTNTNGDIDSSNSNKQDIWLLYFNNISLDDILKQPLTGYSAKVPPRVLANKRFRRSQFSIMHLRTFRRQLYMAIPQSYLLEKSAQSNLYHRYNSDVFIYSALVEMAGSKHTLFVDELVYYYVRANRYSSLPDKRQCMIQARTQTPFQQLPSLNASTGIQDTSYKLTPQQIQHQEQSVDKLIHKMQQRSKYQQQMHSIQTKYQDQQQRLKLEGIVRFMRSVPSGQVVDASPYGKQVDIGRGRETLKQQFKFILNYTSIEEQEVQNMRFAYRLKQYPYNQQYQDAERYNYARKYIHNNNKQHQHQADTGRIQGQQQFCLITYLSQQSNTQKYRYFQSNLKYLIDSISRQKYTNYILNIAVEALHHNSLNTILHYIRAEHPWLLPKINIISDNSSSGQSSVAYGQMYYINHAIANYCGSEDVILPIPASGQIIGSYFLSLLSVLYQTNPQSQMLHSRSLCLWKTGKQQNKYHIVSSHFKNETLFDINDHIINNKWYFYFPYSFTRTAYLAINREYFCYTAKKCIQRLAHAHMFKALHSTLKQQQIRYIPQINYLSFPQYDAFTQRQLASYHKKQTNHIQNI